MSFRQHWRWGALAVLALVSLACFAFPMYVIRPFRAQDPGQLAAALAVKAWGVWVAPAAAVLAVWIGWPLVWRRNWVRFVAALGMVLAVAGAGLSRFNVYEKMFHRIDHPDFLTANEAKLDPKDMVLAIRLGGAAAAFPIRMMGYHHIANVILGSSPAVVTY